MPQEKIGFYGRFQPTGVDTSGAQRLQALAGLGQKVGEIALDVGAKKRAEQGYEAGLTAGTQAAETGEAIKPRDSIMPTFFDDAYNKGMKSSYIAGVQAKARENLSRYYAEAGPDLEKFNQLSSGYIEGLSGKVAEEMKPYVTATMNELVGTYRAQIAAQQGKIARESSGQELMAATSTSMRDSLNLLKMGDFLGAQTALGEAFATVDAQVDALFKTEEQGKEEKRVLLMQFQGQNARSELDKTIKEKGVIGAVDYINSIDEKGMDGFGVDDKDNLLQILRSDLSQYLNLENVKEQEMADSLKARQDAAASDLFLGILSGESDQSDITMALQGKSLRFSDASTLTNLVNNRGRGVDDFSLIRDITSVTYSNPAVALGMIQRNAGTSLTDKTATDLYKTAMAAMNEESPLNSSYTKRFRGFLQDSVKVVGPMGVVNFDSQKRLANLEVVFDMRVANGEDAAIVASELVDVDELVKEGDPLYGSIDNLDESERITTEKFQAGAIDDYTYDAEIEKIRNLKKGLRLRQEFERSLNLALKRSENK